MTKLTIATLADAYKAHEDSRYTGSRPRTRDKEGYRIARLKQDCGSTTIADIKAAWLIRKHKEWSAGGTIPWAYELVSLVRRLCGFGFAFLEEAECDRVIRMMAEMTFKKGKPRTQRLTYAQVVAIIAEANRVERPMIALAQALMWDCGWRQTDAIGEYIDRSEPDETDIEPVRYGKWVRGARWPELGADLVLRHVTSKRGAPSEMPILYAPLVLAQLRLMFGSVDRSVLPARGAIIINEKTGWPFSDGEFRKAWRKIATAAGVPKDVQNRDSRAGRATDARSRNLSRDQIQALLGHSKGETTEIYLRDPAGVTAAVMKQLSETMQ